MAVTPEMIMKVRYEVQDLAGPGLYILDDTTITYFLEKNSEIIRLASLDAARAILLRLSMNATDEIVDIFSIKGSKSASEYRQSLELYLKNTTLNSSGVDLMPYAGGVSVSDMQANNSNLDNFLPPTIDRSLIRTDIFAY